MQDAPLSILMILQRAVSLGQGMKVVSVEPAGIDRRSWPEVGERAARIGPVLDSLGVPQGAVVGSFAWNGHRHLELYYGVPSSGRVLHAINVRLHAEVIEYVVGHADDSVIFVDASLTPALAPLRHRLGVRACVVVRSSRSATPNH